MNNDDDSYTMGDIFRDWSEIKKKKRQSNLAYSTNLLIEQGIAFESKNGGVHLIVKADDTLIDFWPSTGFFTNRKAKRSGRGVRNLIKLVRGKKNVSEQPSKNTF
ncbi:hypothetical protein DM558_07770 [Entomomonas moraniae]|uniref:Uncharacterized protein n=1 Tax=Entomomonas moraniae TaxID=2213226 RepID=A0A3S9XE01_9GAMM|nr:hypothetical protein [Entomomonas moraniae]AZS50682.1 hypothetical protein DM558_07770 [Entomomonas moraniae]